MSKYKGDYAAFNTIMMITLDQHAPVKKTFVRANDGPFMTKTLRKGIMINSKLNNKNNNVRSTENHNAYKV